MSFPLDCQDFFIHLLSGLVKYFFYMFLFPVSSISGAILDNITQFLSNYNLEKDTDRFSGKCNVVENRSWWMRDNF